MKGSVIVMLQGHLPESVYNSLSHCQAISLRYNINWYISQTPIIQNPIFQLPVSLTVIVHVPGNHEAQHEMASVSVKLKGICSESS